MIELSFSRGLEVLLPTIAYSIGVGIFAVFILNFYRIMARRDIFALDFFKPREPGNVTAGKGRGALMFVVKYALLYPLVSFAWFVVVVFMLAIMSADKEVKDLLLISVLVLTIVRATSRYSDALAQTVASLLPFAVMGVFLFNLQHIAFDLTDLMGEVLAEGETFFYYWIFIVLLEIALQVPTPFFRFVRNKLKVSA